MIYDFIYGTGGFANLNKFTNSSEIERRNDNRSVFGPRVRRKYLKCLQVRFRIYHLCLLSPDPDVRREAELRRVALRPGRDGEDRDHQRPREGRGEAICQRKPRSTRTR